MSELDEPNMLCDGKRVIQLDQWVYDKDALIIVAISPTHRKEVVRYLTQKGYDNYILLPKKGE